MERLLLKNRKKSTPKETIRKADKLVGRNVGILKNCYELRMEPDDFGMYSYYPDLTNTSHFSRLKCPSEEGSGSINREKSKAAAIGEALERYCGSIYRPEEFVFNSYRETRKEAIDVQDLILYSETQYKEPRFNLKRPSDETKISWTWGYSLIKKKPVLVPSCLLFLPYKGRNEEPSFVETVSTGAACGNTIEEAILSGIYEVVERDAFMIWWLNKLKMPRIDLSTGDKFILRMIERIYYTDLELYVLDITTDIKIPSFVALIRGKSEPFLVCGARADLDPQLGMLQAVEEALQTKVWAKQLAKKNPDYRYMENFSNIANFREHVLLYAKIDLWPKLDFIINSAPSLKINDIPDKSSPNILENIKTCLKKFSEKGKDVVIVNITSEDIATVGFYVVKVIIPGMQSLNANYRYRHLGGERLKEVPKTLGYADYSHGHELNKYPHPFP